MPPTAEPQTVDLEIDIEPAPARPRVQEVPEYHRLRKESPPGLSPFQKSAVATAIAVLLISMVTVALVLSE